MARKLRVEYSGAIYHVMSRGDHWEVIFRGDEDRKMFLATLGEAGAKTGWQVHVLCLLANHFHLGESGGGHVYVHLNPVRAKLVRSKAPLESYGWSSWPEYLKAPRRRWPWLRVDRLPGTYHVPQDSAAGRRLRTETPMTLKWIAAELHMGVWSHVSNLLSQHRRKQKRKDN